MGNPDQRSFFDDEIKKEQETKKRWAEEFNKKAEAERQEKGTRKGDEQNSEKNDDGAGWQVDWEREREK